jgi:hypothetical protein
VEAQEGLEISAKPGARTAAVRTLQLMCLLLQSSIANSTSKCGSKSQKLPALLLLHRLLLPLLLLKLTSLLLR